MTITGIPNLLPPTLPTPAPIVVAANPPPSPTITLPDTDAPQQLQAVNLQAIDHKRLQAVQEIASSISNIYVVSDRKFTIFKDATGQYITRFTSLKDGKITYIPEPQLLRNSNAGIDPAILNINA